MSIETIDDGRMDAIRYAMSRSNLDRETRSFYEHPEFRKWSNGIIGELREEMRADRRLAFVSGCIAGSVFGLIVVWATILLGGCATIGGAAAGLGRDIEAAGRIVEDVRLGAD